MKLFGPKYYAGVAAAYAVLFGIALVAIGVNSIKAESRRDGTYEVQCSPPEWDDAAHAKPAVSHSPVTMPVVQPYEPRTVFQFQFGKVRFSVERMP